RRPVTSENIEPDGEIRPYLEEREAASTRGLQRGPVLRVVRRFSTPALRYRGKLAVTGLLAPYSRRKARSYLRERPDLRLHLASGANRLPGWVNIDILGMKPDLHWDLARGIPFPDESARAVFLEHFLEHLTFLECLDVLAE